MEKLSFDNYLQHAMMQCVALAVHFTKNDIFVISSSFYGLHFHVSVSLPKCKTFWWYCPKNLNSKHQSMLQNVPSYTVCFP